MMQLMLTQTVTNSTKSCIFRSASQINKLHLTFDFDFVSITQESHNKRNDYVFEGLCRFCDTNTALND